MTQPDRAPEPLSADLPARVVVGANGAYWRDYGDHYSMCPVSEDNDPVEIVAIYDRNEATALADLRDAVEIMDQKVTPLAERGDGTVSTYAVGDSTWHRVLAVARGSVSEKARIAIDTFRRDSRPVGEGLRVDLWGNPNRAARMRSGAPHGDFSVTTGRCKTCNQPYPCAGSDAALSTDQPASTEAGEDG